MPQNQLIAGVWPFRREENDWQTRKHTTNAFDEFSEHHIEHTQREETSRMGRKKAKRKTASKKKATIEEYSKKVTKKRSAQTAEEETPNTSIQQKSMHQKPSTQGVVTARRSLEDASRRTSRASKRAQVKVFVEETFRKGVKGLIAEFKMMKRVNDFTKMTEFVAQNPQGRNRYKVRSQRSRYKITNNVLLSNFSL
ncbi:hypothetical protein DICVIV_05531 [Dictyocaulus viviparus]|uniref:Uncharacterized protein n=1 Tax=Dictyocaulus viviparus TaxID=29172 RepID=A0A0D8XV22_DICVI|nr:hypothetical protein DICVIV_05531 [Dictyocaulus viviparus]